MAQDEPGMGGALMACLACGGTATPQVGRWATGFESFAGGQSFHHPPYAIQHCESCGLYFKSATLPLDQLDDYYARLDYDTFKADSAFPTDRLLRRQLDQLPSGSRVLDFGCSTGRILKDLTARLHCYGVEPNTHAAAIASARGIHIVSEADLRTGDPCGFDAILLADVYEHLPHPIEIIALLVGLLRPGGRLAIVTGNADAVPQRDYIGEFWYFRTPSHLLMLSRRHVDWLAARFGLEREAVHVCSHYDTPLVARALQHARYRAYFLFRRFKSGPAAALLRAVPLLNRAARWTNAPALDCTRDHVVVVLLKPTVVSGS